MPAPEEDARFFKGGKALYLGTKHYGEPCVITNKRVRCVCLCVCVCVCVCVFECLRIHVYMWYIQHVCVLVG